MENTNHTQSSSCWTGKFAGVIPLPVACLFGAAIGFLIPADWKAEVIAHTAWPVTLLLLGITAWIAMCKIKVPDWGTFCRSNGLILLTAGIILLVFSVNDNHRNKIIHDELVLQGSAVQLLQDGGYRIPQFSHNLQIEYEVIGEIPDKRPPLFPVLLSILHRLLGYSQANGFVLNALLGICLFYFVGKCGQLLLPGIGWLAGVGAFATMPLLSQNITSQHMEVLYLTLIAALAFVSLRIVLAEKLDEIPLGYLVATLIAFTRYEGLLFLMVPFFVHLHAHLRFDAKPRLKYAYWVLPLGMAFVFCLVGHVFNHPAFWQLDDFDNDAPFSPVYWSKNVGALFDYLLTTDRTMSNSLVLSIGGLAAFPITTVLVFRALVGLFKGDDSKESRVALLIGLLGLSCGLFLLLIFSYHWGYVNSYETARFMLFPYFVSLLSLLFSLKHKPMAVLIVGLVISLFTTWQTLFIDEDKLPLTLPLIMAGNIGGIVYLLVRRSAQLPLAGFALFMGIFLFSETIPSINQRKYELDGIPMKRAAIFKEWVAERKSTNAVFISDSSLYGILARESATDIMRFAQNPDILLNLFKERRFSSVFVLQMFGLKPDGSIQVLDKWQIPEGLLYEEVEWRRINDASGVRMIRILGWDPDAEITEPVPAQSASADPEA